ncbi:hypothetical protein AB0B95_11805 [Streptomyces hygroscopicus]|uniref:hypothetical protein n=1 Tax=Streptomyces hygroscopicus TaxID=1912 RepID=UPI000767A2EF|nr:hypothetical protein [Streptomyces hygroscopicus]
MTESGAGGTAPYPDAARARLVTSYEACELADLARAAVPIGEHELHPDGTTRTPGAVLAHAARVLAAAQRFLEAAAVFERAGGADWQLIGAVLDMSPHTAQMRFATPEAAFRKELHAPESTHPGHTADEMISLRAHMTREPLETALDLDDWVLRHEDGTNDLGTAPVSGGLTRENPQQHTDKPP